MKRKRTTLSGMYRAYYGSFLDHRRALANVVSYCNAWVSPDVFFAQRSPYPCSVQHVTKRNRHKEGATMKHEIDLLDDEYMTPQQAAELRRTMTELPLWQQVAPNIDVVPHAIDCFSTEGASQVQTDIELHRALNWTTGMESEA